MTQRPYHDAAFAVYPHRCDRCGAAKTGRGSLHVHHRDFDHANDEIANLQILCRRCHKRVHMEAGQSEQIWRTRRAKGGAWNEVAVRPDGSLRGDCYRDDPDTGCRIWTGTIRGGVPSYAGRGSGGGWVAVRRTLWRIHRGEPVPENVGASCEDSRCVAVDHLQEGKTWNGHPREIREYVEAASPFASRRVIASRLGVSASSVARHLRRTGVAPSPIHHRTAKHFPLGNLPARPHGISERHWSIFTATYGRTLVEVGEQFGVSKQRVDQIVKRVVSFLQREGLAA